MHYRSERVKTHRSKCNQKDKPTASKRTRSPTPTRESPPPKRAAGITRQPTIENSVTATSKDLKQSLDRQFARAFFSCNIPFNVAEHPEFKALIQMLRPGYDVPTRKTLGDQLLDDVYGGAQQTMKEAIQGKNGTIIQDGWSNVHNDPIVATSVQVEGNTFFLDSVDTGSMTKSAENCKKLCQDSIKMAKDQYNCTITAVVTDNAANMNKMRQGLKEDDPNLTVYGCSAHLLNLLGSDVTPKDVMQHVRD